MFSELLDVVSHAMSREGTACNAGFQCEDKFANRPPMPEEYRQTGSQAHLGIPLLTELEVDQLRATSWQHEALVLAMIDNRLKSKS